MVLHVVYFSTHLFTVVLTHAITIEFHNGLDFPIQLVVTQNNVASQQVATIPTGYALPTFMIYIYAVFITSSQYFSYGCSQGFAGNFKHGWAGEGITLFEISVRTNDANTYYDLSVINGFNVPMKVYAPDG